MSSINKAIIVGNLGADPEIRKTNSGDPIANLSVATAEKWKDKQTGERKEKTEWHRVVMFGPLAEVAERYLRKGSKVYLEGAIQTRKWQDQNGADRYSTEIVLSGPRATMAMLDGPSGSPGDPGQQREPQGGRPAEDFSSDTLDDDIPFAEW